MNRQEGLREKRLWSLTSEGVEEMKKQKCGGRDSGTLYMNLEGCVYPFNKMTQSLLRFRNINNNINNDIANPYPVLTTH